MPTYGYQCTECNHTFETVQRITDKPLDECEKCKGKVRRLIYPVGIAFKGSGFHINDYKSSGSGNGSKTETTIPAATPEAKSTETKAPETKAKDTVEAK